MGEQVLSSNQPVLTGDDEIVPFSLLVLTDHYLTDFSLGGPWDLSVVFQEQPNFFSKNQTHIRTIALTPTGESRPGGTCKSAGGSGWA